jgi:hypothetical protein
MDQGVHFNDLMPAINKDSLGIWLTDTWWGNAMRKERWREALVMDLGRGNLLFPQIWGELRWFNDADVEFLARIQKLAKANEALFHKRHSILGDPWDNEVYGYSYFQGSHGFIFMNNVDFKSRTVRLSLDATIGLAAHPDDTWRITSHFPDRAELNLSGDTKFRSGQSFEAWLRPFEVAMWEVTAQGPTHAEGVLAKRNVSASQAGIESRLLPLQSGLTESWMQINFGEPSPEFRSTVRRPTLSEFKDMGYQKRVLAYRSTLPEFTGPHMLALVLRFKKDGKWWRHRQPADLVQAKAMMGDQPIVRFETVPNFRQTENNEWCPWLVFRIRTSPEWSAKSVALAVNAYLPPEVEIQAEGWLVPRWWETVLDI